MIANDALIKEWIKLGGSMPVLKSKDANSIFIDYNKIVSSNLTEEIIIERKETENGININLKVKEGVNVKEPINLCFGVMGNHEVQNIKINANFGKNSISRIIASCIFPNSKKLVHNMDAVFTLEEGSRFSYTETHFHGQCPDIIVNPKAKIIIGKNAEYSNSFNLFKGRAGKINFDYALECGENSKSEMSAKINAIKTDEISLKESANLSGKGSSAVIASRVILSESSKGNVYNKIVGFGDESRGHIDCIEILNGKNAKAYATPVVEVTNDSSKVTHEAAIGSINKEEIITLMGKGISENEAIKVIIKGILN